MYVHMLRSNVSSVKEGEEQGIEYPSSILVDRLRVSFLVLIIIYAQLCAIH